jgi:ADP-L-glycero-D-manno-heptose 6-epimerase
MNIILTGYKGFIGSNLRESLYNAGHQIRLYEIDDPTPTVEGFDWVIHVGGLSSTTERDVDRVLKYNTDYTIELFDRCVKSNVNFQYASSASVYGLVSDFGEASPVDPRNPYAWSKYLAERYIINNTPDTMVLVKNTKVSRLVLILSSSSRLSSLGE